MKLGEDTAGEECEHDRGLDIAVIQTESMTSLMQRNGEQIDSWSWTDSPGLKIVEMLVSSPCFLNRRRGVEVVCQSVPFCVTGSVEGKAVAVVANGPQDVDRPIQIRHSGFSPRDCRVLGPFVESASDFWLLKIPRYVSRSVDEVIHKISAALAWSVPAVTNRDEIGGRAERCQAAGAEKRPVSVDQGI